MLFVSLVLLSCILQPIFALDNGLAKTPPMGWLHWQRFRCNVDCETYPEDCVRDQLFREMADAMVYGGWKDAGYQYIIIDDCWLTKERDVDGKLQADPDRFPEGITGLADYVHSLGLKFGIYEDYGTHTCAGYPGSMGYIDVDAQTFADWGVDYLKFDGCNGDGNVEQGQLDMAAALSKTGRDIVFSCESPLYVGKDNSNMTKVAAACNLWRVWQDVQDNWGSLKSIVEFYRDNQEIFVPFGGPGQWNDLDMLVIGDYGLSLDQSIYQMTIWSIIAAPLIMSNDLRTIRSEFAEILLNKDIIKVNQDPLGIPGSCVLIDNNINFWVRKISPIIGEEHSYAIGITNNEEGGFPTVVNVDLEKLNLTHASGYQLKRIFGEVSEGIVLPSEGFKVRVNLMGAVTFTLTPVDEN